MTKANSHDFVTSESTWDDHDSNSLDVVR